MIYNSFDIHIYVYIYIWMTILHNNLSCIQYNILPSVVPNLEVPIARENPLKINSAINP